MTTDPQAATQDMEDGPRPAWARMIAAFREGRLADAAAQADQLLRQYPGNQGVLLRCVVVWQALGRHNRALSVIRGALSVQEETADLHEAAGVSCAALRDGAGAIAHWRAALAIVPESASVRFRLGEALAEGGHRTEAEEILRHAVRAAPNLANLWCLLGRVVAARGGQEEALLCYQRAIQCDPRHGEALSQAGEVLVREERYQEAMEVYQRTLRVRPSAMVWMRMGAIQHGRGLLPEAEQCYREAVRLDPGDIEARVGLGKALVQRGQWDEARACFVMTLKMRPGFGPARVALLALMERTGSGREAKVQADEWWAQVPDHPELLTLMARLAQDPDERRKVLGHVEARLQRADLPKNMVCALHFAAATLGDKLGDWDGAFHHFTVGNAYRKQEKQYRRADTEQGFAQLKAVFTQAFLRAAPRAPQDGRPPIFIVGMPRSGTSLAEQILASHPDVYGAGELWELEMVLRRRARGPATVPYPQSMAVANAEVLAQMAATYREALPEASRSHAFVTDKMPHNFEHLGAMTLLFPGVRIIHCRRDPIDTMLSCYMQNFGEANGFSHDLADCGFFYRQYAGLMDHWRSVFEEPFFELQYETLVADPEPAVRALLEYCGLPWNDACLRFHENPRVVHTASYKQVREPLYTRSVGRWRHYAAYLTPLVEELGDLVPEADRAFIRTAAEKAGVADKDASQAAVG